VRQQGEREGEREKLLFHLYRERWKGKVHTFFEGGKSWSCAIWHRRRGGKKKKGFFSTEDEKRGGGEKSFFPFRSSRGVSGEGRLKKERERIFLFIPSTGGEEKKKK